MVHSQQQGNHRGGYLWEKNVYPISAAQI
uniref:Uncharacterized protein n=1 Tax=Arundo donax TaxID=35708 RepID=A0A0A9FVS4_ARUDO